MVYRQIKRMLKLSFFYKPSTSDRNYLVIGGFVSVVLITCFLGTGQQYFRVT